MTTYFFSTGNPEALSFSGGKILTPSLGRAKTRGWKMQNVLGRQETGARQQQLICCFSAG